MSNYADNRTAGKQAERKGSGRGRMLLPYKSEIGNTII